MLCLRWYDGGGGGGHLAFSATVNGAGFVLLQIPPFASPRTILFCASFIRRYPSTKHLFRRRMVPSPGALSATDIFVPLFSCLTLFSDDIFWCCSFSNIPLHMRVAVW